MNIPNCPICSIQLNKRPDFNPHNHYLERHGEYFCFNCQQKEYFVKWSAVYWTVSIRADQIGWYSISSITNSNKHAYTKGVLDPIIFNFSIAFQDSFVTLQKYINNQAFL